MFVSQTGSDVQPVSFAPTGTLADIRLQQVEDVERQYLRQQLSINRGRIDATADAAGITPRQLNKLMTKYVLKKEDFMTGQTAGTSSTDP